MDPRADVASLGKPFAHRLSAMIEARYLTYREYIPWADVLARRLNRPPVWIVDLALHKYVGHASTAVSEFAFSEPFEALEIDTWVNEYVAGHYLRYERRELSWATFLNEAGMQADANGGRWACEEFYDMLNTFEESDFAISVEHPQRDQVVAEYGTVIESLRSTYQAIKSSKTIE